MKAMGEIAGQALSMKRRRCADSSTSGPTLGAATRTRTTRSQLPRSWIDGLFARFGAIYGRAWTDRLRTSGPEIVAAEWGEGLAGLEAEEIRRAIEHCRRELTFPPSIAEFRKAARGGSNAEQRAFERRAAAEQASLPQETWAETRARGHRRLRELRAALGQGHGIGEPGQGQGEPHSASA